MIPAVFLRSGLSGFCVAHLVRLLSSPLSKLKRIVAKDPVLATASQVKDLIPFSGVMEGQHPRTYIRLHERVRRKKTLGAVFSPNFCGITKLSFLNKYCWRL